MKKFLACFFVLFCIFSGLSAQSSREIIEFDQNPNAKYRLFRTANVWIFLELNTSNGEIYLVQYSINENPSGSWPINSKSLLSEDEQEIPGRFTLYATTNIYNFIMLDTFTGATYQVQWNFEEQYCFVIPISGSKE